MSEFTSTRVFVAFDRSLKIRGCGSERGIVRGRWGETSGRRECARITRMEAQRDWRVRGGRLLEVSAEVGTRS